ncbi:hypothetical protein ZIOFF_073317 [Zingiber officinale]|uniref:Histone deacetylase complex subunit SAP30 Sin3 binding domain-containing protein n=1 Tax=Zingiber officinale TaxID=94328 RepID=A0A8J5EMB8_ZINOF|nr:hypothetical protein ZIOFF_073317 [Zingiber officinale]
MLAAVDRRMSGGCQQSCGESSEEELSVLPRHTKVVVTGNNRTKSVLVGLHGVVKKAVGLGGWHWLVLTNGIEVKLQRNALSVIEAPTGQEDDDDEFNNMKWNDSDISKYFFFPFQVLRKLLVTCSVPEDLVGMLSILDSSSVLKQGMACIALATSFCQTASDSIQLQTPQKLRNKNHKGFSNKLLSQSHFSDSHSKGSVLSTSCTTKVDLSKLETTALWRYSKHFNLVSYQSSSRCSCSQPDSLFVVGGIPNPSKEQLIEIVQRHFMSQQLDELQVIVGFVQAAKRLKSVSD